MSSCALLGFTLLSILVGIVVGIVFGPKVYRAFQRVSNFKIKWSLPSFRLSFPVITTATAILLLMFMTRNVETTPCSSKEKTTVAQLGKIFTDCDCEIALTMAKK